MLIDPDSERIVISENVAIRLMNSTEISAENFFSAILKRYREEQERLRQQTATNGQMVHTSSSLSTVSAHLAIAMNEYEGPPKETSRMGASRSDDFIAPTSTSVTPTESSQPNAMSYMDDEDMVNDYDNTEGSASRPMWNDTAAAFAILNENDIGIDDDTD